MQIPQAGEFRDSAATLEHDVPEIIPSIICACSNTPEHIYLCHSCVPRTRGQGVSEGQRRKLLWPVNSRVIPKVAAYINSA